MDVVVVVDYYDGDRGSFTVQYDSHDPLAGVYKFCPEWVSLAGSHTWKTARFPVVNARLCAARTRRRISGSLSNRRSCTCVESRSSALDRSSPVAKDPKRTDAGKQDAEPR